MDDEINLQRYEALLYLLIQSKLDGHLYIPQSLKYRCLKDDLLNDETWKNKKNLIKQSMLNRLDTSPKKLMQSMKSDLDNEITLVGERIQKGDNQNVVLKTRTNVPLLSTCIFCKHKIPDSLGIKLIMIY